LVHVEFKKHDPQRVVSNHLANYGLKRFEHENSPSDDIFQGTRSYAEVLARIQALAPEERADVLKFQEHRWSCLPLVLRGENPIIVEVQQKEAEGSKDSAPRQEKHQDRGEKTRSLKPEMKTLDLPKRFIPWGKTTLAILFTIFPLYRLSASIRPVKILYFYIYFMLYRVISLSFSSSIYK
jgi:hypothetical protein